MDECKYFGYFEKFENIRQVKLTELLVSHKLKSIQPSIMGRYLLIYIIYRNYEKNSNYIIQLIILSLKLFEVNNILKRYLYIGGKIVNRANIRRKQEINQEIFVNNRSSP